MFRTHGRARLHSRVRVMLRSRTFFLVTCTSFTFSLIWLQLVTSPDVTIVNESLIQEVIDNVAQDSRFSEVYRKTSRLPKGLKYMLIWADKELAPLYFFGDGQKQFLKQKCGVINCYITSDRGFFGGDVTKFDAIAFNGRTVRSSDLPQKRSPHQKYIFFNMESSDNYPVCSPVFDNFFNWTSTYRLDSDIPFTYMAIKNRKGDEVGPKIGMEWPGDLPDISEDLAERLMNKTKAAAWFVSHCSARSRRHVIASKLQKALLKYGHTVDIYGRCGPMKCPRDVKNDCNKLLERDYFFYLSLENSFDEDYVTEKLLTALQHGAVPIVYGGADYSRFLPPGSYLDARRLTPSELAAEMDRMMNSPHIYRSYFRWRSEFTYSDRFIENVCSVCATLNDKHKLDTVTTYEHFRNWWLPNYEGRC